MIATLDLLKYNYAILLQSIQTLEKSLEKCKKIGGKDNYSFEEMESFDSLTSKFARTSDIYTQKVLRTVLILLRESQNTFIDMVNKAEQIELINSADNLINIRDLRNEIAHEYIEEELFEIYKQTITYTEILINNINLSKNYITKKF